MSKAAGDAPKWDRKETLDFNTWLQRIPGALTRLREKALLTENEVAPAALATPGQIRAWESGEIFPSMRSLVAFLVATKSNPYDLAEALVGSDPVDTITSLSQRIATLEEQMSSVLSQIQAESLDQEP